MPETGVLSLSRTMYDDILIPTDGSEAAERAVDYGVVLAAAFDATVHALSVVDERDYRGVVDGADAMRAGMDAARADAEEAVAAVAERVDGAVTTHVTTGVPQQAILDYVGSAGVDLVVMSTHGRTGVGRFVIGSVAEKVVRRADVPVVTVRVSDRLPSWPPVDRVVVPTDGSDASFAAVPHALALAERFGAAVEVVSVVDERTRLRLYNVGTALEDVVGGLESTADRAVAQVESRAAERGLDVTTAVVEGLPPRAICSHAETTGASLVVLATHGRTGLAQYLLGSVAERVVRNATVPVCTVPVDDELVES
jgi:nucleotide-binding universal stress UspA family protein